jgi:hypothetical protein
MANKKITELAATTAPVANDVLLIVTDVANTAVTKKVTANTLFNLIPSGKILLANTTNAPASSSANGTVGEIRATSSYIYVCTANNTWKRAALETF